MARVLQKSQHGRKLQSAPNETYTRPGHSDGHDVVDVQAPVRDAPQVLRRHRLLPLGNAELRGQNDRDRRDSSSCKYSYQTVLFKMNFMYSVFSYNPSHIA